MFILFYKLIKRVLISYNKTKINSRINFYKHLHRNSIFLEKNKDWGHGFILTGNPSKFKLIIKTGTNFRSNCTIRMENNSTLTIGSNCFFNQGCSINCFNEIDIGNDCLFGEGIKFYDHNHNYDSSGVVFSKQGFSVGKIKIGKNCWVSSNVIILKNVTIGDNVVIGAGCIVHKSIPSGSIIVNKQNLININ